MTSPTFAPGWYPEGAHLRWWDGQQWGPYAPDTPPQSEEQRGKTMAVVSHLGFAAGGFILPLVLYLIERDKPDRNRFVCHHACEALNWSITFMIVWLGGFVVMFGSFFVTVGWSTEGEPSFPVVPFLIFPLFFVAMGLNWVFGILGMVRANKGEWWRYPVCIRFVGRGVDWRTA